MKTITLLAGFLLAAVQAATAQDVDLGALDRALDSMASADEASYLQRRAEVLAFGAAAVPALTERGADDRWTAEGWLKALAAEICRIRISNPTLAESVDRPRGLDPERYTQNRKPLPVCAPDLVHAGKDAVPLLIERWRWTYAEMTFSEGEAGDLERTTFRRAIVFVPGELEDLRARHFVGGILVDRTQAWVLRQEAAVAYGITGGAEALPRISAVLDNRGEPVEVREACARALGRVPTVEALAAMRQRLTASNEDPQIVRSLLTGLGLLGSSWAWEARGPALATMAGEVRSGCADALIESLQRFPAESETIGRALQLTAWEPSVGRLEEFSQDLSASEEVRRAAEDILPGLRNSIR